MRLEFVLVITALVLFVLIFDALRRRRLTEGFAILWSGAGVAAVLLVVGRRIVDSVSTAIGFSYGSSLVFAAAGVFLVIVCLVLSMQVTRLRKQVETLAQEIALASARNDGGRVDGGTTRDGDDDSL